MSYIILIGIYLGIILFPLWCAIIMKFVCKNFSDDFIIRFLGCVCSLQFAISLFPTAMTMQEHVDVSQESLYIFKAVIFFGGISVYYFIITSIARAGIGIINRLNHKNASKRTASTRSA